MPNTADTPRVVHTDADPTEAQLSFANRLANERRLTDDQRTWLDAQLASTSLTRGRVSQIIDRLRTLPLADANDPAQANPGVTLPPPPAGRYALLGDDGVVRFYRVDRPTDGRWAGYTFLKPVYGSPGSLRTGERLQRSTERRVLAEIAADPKTASIRFGKELGHCGVCGSPLTNEESRELGIGPVCRGRLGW
jgi:hypothetical protein